MEKIQPEKVLEVLCQKGVEVTLQQAEIILELLKKLADIAVSQYLTITEFDQNQ